MRYSNAELSEAFLAADRLLNGPVRPAIEVVRILEPFFDCTEVDGLSGQSHEDTRSMIFALVGDAYRREGSVHEAGAWYRRASNISSGGHATIYAHLVCKNQLSDYYDDALTTLREHQRRWRAKPVVWRLLSRLVAWRMWADPEGRVIARSESQNLRFLIQNAPKKPTTSQPAVAPSSFSDTVGSPRVVTSVGFDRRSQIPPLAGPQNRKLSPPQWVWIGWPLILIVLGGAIGGACGAGAFALNHLVFQKTENRVMRYLWTGLISIAAVVMFLVLAAGFELLFRRR